MYKLNVSKKLNTIMGRIHESRLACGFYITMQN